ncbi:MAG: hypothetical protein KGI94_13675 [Paracoccaceae bacterium]|nr:hypothetical protein [Paracoccaceae bacterium]MDE3122600.1 hypothetical protein [Paracoccaceae bacterium]MDE3237694.1 hypothetical protein [Paracoccaceae bacterium]
MKAKILLALLGVGMMSACSGNLAMPYDVPLSQPANENVGVWVSPKGCQNWYFIDGTGAFMSPRLTPNGKPVCNTPALPPKAAAVGVPAPATGM